MTEHTMGILLRCAFWVVVCIIAVGIAFAFGPLPLWLSLVIGLGLGFVGGIVATYLFGD